RHWHRMPPTATSTPTIDAQHFLAAGRDRVVEAEALDIAAIALVAAVGHHDVVEGTLLRAATCQTNRYHVCCFPRDFPRTARRNRRDRKSTRLNYSHVK